MGYESALLIADGIKRAGSTDPEEIQKALADNRHNPIKAGVIMSFDKTVNLSS